MAECMEEIIAVECAGVQRGDSDVPNPAGLNSIFGPHTIVSRSKFWASSRGVRNVAMAKILVVDDETNVRQVIGMLLFRAGYEVIEAEHGLIGYSKAQSDNPDLIVLDLMMPFMDGYEVLQKLKGNPATKKIPVIILTAKIDATSEHECMRLGAVDYIKKPWGPRELEDRVGMALGYPEVDRPRKFRTVQFRVGSDEQDPEAIT